MLENIIEQRNKAIALAEAICNSPDLSEQARSSTLQRDVTALRENKFQIAIVAPFSAGKSTFINALLGTDLLSMALEAETATITRVRKGGRPAVTVHYRDSSESDTVPADGALLSKADYGFLDDLTQSIQEDSNYSLLDGILPFDVDTLDPDEIHILSLKRLLQVVSTVQEDQEKVQAITRYLKHYELAQGEDNEKKVEEVIVEWDLKLCDEGVEFVDTPGLFSRHENHNSITNHVLPQAHAVLFLVQPDKTGEANFGRVIRDYVKEAKASNLDAHSNHIFFLVNKIDQYPRSFDKVCDELNKWLDGILPNPKVLRVSSYFAMRARQFLHGEISLEDLQADMIIRIPDPANPRFPLSGRDLTPAHARNIIEHSYILEVEQALGNYLDGRHQILVNNVYHAVEAIHRYAIEDLEQGIQVANIHLEQAQINFGERISGARGKINELNADLHMSSEKVIIRRLMQDESSGVSIPKEIEDFMKVQSGTLKRKVREAIEENWHGMKSRITESTAECKLDELVDESRSDLVTGTKDLLKRAINEVLKPGVQRLTNELQGLFERNNIDVNKILEEQLAIESVANNTDYGLDRLAVSIERVIENTFSQMLQNFDFSQAIRKAANDAVSYQRKAGLWNWFKSWFGCDEQERKFDSEKFRAKIEDEVISQLIQDARECVDQLVDNITNSLIGNQGTAKKDSCIEVVRKSMQAQVKDTIKFQQNRMDKHLARLQKELGASEEDIRHSIYEKENARRRVKAALAAIEVGENPYLSEVAV